jgi:hypothetical protein
MQHLSYMLTATTITDFTFGVYSASSLHMNTLGYLCTHICNDLMWRFMFPVVYSTTAIHLILALLSTEPSNFVWRQICPRVPTPQSNTLKPLSTRFCSRSRATCGILLRCGSRMSAIAMAV